MPSKQQNYALARDRINEIIRLEQEMIMKCYLHANAWVKTTSQGMVAKAAKISGNQVYGFTAFDGDPANQTARACALADRAYSIVVGPPIQPLP